MPAIRASACYKLQHAPRRNLFTSGRAAPPHTGALLVQDDELEPRLRASLHQKQAALHILAALVQEGSQRNTAAVSIGASTQWSWHSHEELQQCGRCAAVNLAYCHLQRCMPRCTRELPAGTAGPQGAHTLADQIPTPSINRASLLQHPPSAWWGCRNRTALHGPQLPAAAQKGEGTDTAQA